MQIVCAPLEKFYDALSNAQKHQFDSIGRAEGTASVSQGRPEVFCDKKTSGATNVPVEHVEQVVQPNAQQRETFNALKAAAAKAAEAERLMPDRDAADTGDRSNQPPQ